MSNPPPNINPYATPSSSIPPALPENTLTENAIFHQGKWLIVHKRAHLPDRCVKSNEPTTDRLKRNLTWHHPAIYLVILFNLLIYVIIALVLRKTAVLQVPLAKRYKTRRRWWMAIAWSSFLLGVGILVAFIALEGRGTLWLGFLAFFALTLTGLMIGLFGCRVVYAKRMDDHYVWLGGTCEPFRHSFPEWPYRV